MHKTDLEQILDYARLAPSSHNTQPWAVALTKNGFKVRGDRLRHLRIGDPTKREMAISIGCFVEAAYKAAHGLGFNCSVTVDEKESEVELKFNPSAQGDIKWLNLLRERSSDRRLYTSRQLEDTLFVKLCAVDMRGSSCHIIQDKKSITRLADLTARATRKLMSTTEFRSELADWVRNNWTKKHDGMPGYTQGIPGPLSLLAKKVIKNNKAVASSQAKKDANRIHHSAAVVIITVKQDAFSDWIKAGRQYLSLCLIAQEEHAKTSAISAAVIDPSCSEEVKKLLNTAETPVCLIRVGYLSGHVKKTPRRTVQEFLVAAKSPKE